MTTKKRKTKTLTIHVSVSLHAKLKTRAAKLGIPLQKLVADLLSEKV